MKSLSAALVAVSLLLAEGVSAGMFSSKGAVKMLDSKTYTKTLAEGDMAMIAYVAPWCGHCKNLVPEYEKAASSLSPLIPFYAVDCDAEANKPLCGREGVRGFPTIKAFRGKGAGRDYQGERKAGALVEYASGLVPDKVKKLHKLGDVEGSWLAENADLPHVLLLHPSQPSIPLMWKVLAARLHKTMHFGYHRDTDGVAKRALGADFGEGPKVIVWYKGEKTAYDSVLKYEPLYHFLKEAARGNIAGQNVGPGSPVEPSAESTTTATLEATPTVDHRAEQRREMQAKWQEEERRDRQRREKREKERAARAVSEQDRVGELQDEAEATGTLSAMDQTPTDVAAEDTEQSPGTPLEAAAEDFEHGETPRKARAAEGSEHHAHTASAMDSTPTDVGARDTGKSPETPLEAAAEDIDHGETPVKRDETDEGMSLKPDEGTSAETPLQEASEDFEHGQSHDGEEAVQRIIDEL